MIVSKPLKPGEDDDDNRTGKYFEGEARTMETKNGW
jgi:hypothetical protein